MITDENHDGAHMTTPAAGADAAWWEALTLAERLPAPPFAAPNASTLRRLQRWREQSAFLDEAQFAAYWATCGITQADLAALLTEDAAELQARQPASWLTDLAAALTVGEQGRGIEGLDGFLLVAEPLLVWAVERTLGQLASVAAGHLFDAALVTRTVLSTLAPQLGPLVERALVLELHIARLQGELTGDTPAARFTAFTARLRNPAVRGSLLAEYPVLARQLVNRARQTAASLAEVLARLAADWPAIVATFFHGVDPGTVAAVALGEGDTHNDGRSVAILTFAGGQKLVYKPRALAVDAVFQRLLIWLNAHGADPAYRLLTVLARNGYGWVEFVAGAPCRDAGEVARFYVRQGGYLALLYTLYAGDFHFENLVAAGEHPVLIDLEALFHPNLLDYDPTRPEHLAQQAIDDSVLSVSMLPQRLRFAGSTAAIDLSGMGAGGAQTTPDKLPTWEGAGTDEMRLRRQHMTFTTEGHRPTLDGEAVDVRSQGQAVARGFAQVYAILRKHRDELLAPDGLLQQFAGVEVRIVARATRTYSLLLQENSHPDLLRSALERDCFYSALWREVAANPRLARLVPAEVRDLHNGDVPIFHARPGARHLWDSRGHQVADFLPQSGLERVTARLLALNDDDLARQLWYIGASFATLSRGDSHAAERNLRVEEAIFNAETQRHGEAEGQNTDASAPLPLRASALKQPPIEFDLLAAARAIGDRLEQTAHRHGDHAVWIGLGLDGGEDWALNPLTMHLYDGHAGVALFLAYLGQATADARYTDLAAAALATLRVQVEQQRATFYYPGGFSGWGGVIYTLTHLGSLWQRPDLWQEAAALAELAASRLNQDEQFDIIGGAAGYIGAVAALWRCTGDDRLVVGMTQAADHLVAHAQPQAMGVGWIVPGMGGRALAGFSHGAAGIAWALLVAAQITGNAVYRDVARQALAYERTLYDAAAQNWRDLRGETDVADHFMHAWCHGAPGIGLARLASQPLLDDPQLPAEIAAALASTAAQGFGGGHSLCHGDFGNLELFVAAAEGLARPDLLASARRLASAWLATQPQTGWRCGVPGGVETPGLLVGIAGIGYALLRLADPAAIPSVLLLEAPCGEGVRG
jgi:type 2 lantibiotic biosynthesis protein LanM